MNALQGSRSKDQDLLVLWPPTSVPSQGPTTLIHRRLAVHLRVFAHPNMQGQGLKTTNEMHSPQQNQLSMRPTEQRSTLRMPSNSTLSVRGLRHNSYSNFLLEFPGLGGLGGGTVSRV
jgi:hypothetical protein